MQGRGDYEQWVKTLKVSYTMNGRVWKDVDNGSIFEANTNRHEKKKIDFKVPVYARAIRLNPLTYHGYPSMRYRS